MPPVKRVISNQSKDTLTSFHLEKISSVIPDYLKLKGTPSYSLTFSPVFFSFFNHFIQVYFTCHKIYPF